MKLRDVVRILFICLLISGCGTTGQLPFYEQQGDEADEDGQPDAVSEGRSDQQPRACSDGVGHQDA